MTIIKEPHKSVKQLIGEIEVFYGEEYRPISFALLVNVSGHSAAYNSLTGELLLIDEQEEKLLKSDKVVLEKGMEDLVKKSFLVPIEHDDMQLRDEVVDFCCIINSNKKPESFVIFPTTDCNARCFYCFELGKKHLNMSDEVARDTLKYILESGKKNISLKWFGGEPLYNSRAVDIITEGLRDAGVEYGSQMVSNAYLFDDTRIEKAKNLWKLRHVQVTLDGTEKIYNRIKAYIYRDGKSPFQVVMDNIERLLKADMYVSVRLNMDNYNFEDLLELVDILHERFGGYKKIGVSSSRLYELSDRPNSIHTDIERAELGRKWLELEDKISKLGMHRVRPLAKSITYHRCMADSDETVVIFPDGHLGKCEHYIDDRFIGDIYNGITDITENDIFKKRIDASEICKGCKMYPLCVNLKACPATEVSGICDEASRQYKEKDLYRSVEQTVEKYLSKTAF